MKDVMTMDEIINILSKVDTERSVIPENCIYFSEMSDYISEYANDQLNEMIRDIGESELSIFESTGSLVLYEGKKAENLKTKIKDNNVKVWSVRKNFYEKALSYSKQEKINSRKITNSCKCEISELQVFGKTHDFLDLSNVKFSENAIKFIEEAIKVAKSIFKNSNKEDIKEATDMLEQSVCSKVSGINGVKTIKEMKAALKTKYTGEQISATGRWVKSNWSKICSTVNNASYSIIKASYNEEKKAMSSIINKIGTELDGMEDYSVIVGTMMGLAYSTMQACYSVILDISKRQTKEYQNIISRVNKECKKAKSTNEAVDGTVEEKPKETEEEVKKESFKASTTQYDMNNKSFDF